MYRRFLTVAIGTAVAAACTNPAGPRFPVSPQLADGGTISLTHLCGNAYGISTTSTDSLTLRYVVAESAESGIVVVNGRRPSTNYCETSFTVSRPGTVSLYLGETLLQSVDATSVSCPADERPAVPPFGPVPDDSLYTVQSPDDTVPIFYRRYVMVFFNDSASGLAVNAFLQERAAQIIAGNPLLGGHLLQLPDPGPAWSDYQAMLSSIRSDPRVWQAQTVLRRSLQPGLFPRLPHDAVGERREQGGLRP
jgi:hypothetical protein